MKLRSQIYFQLNLNKYLYFSAILNFYIDDIVKENKIFTVERK